jgi:hypothetical protein
MLTSIEQSRKPVQDVERQQTALISEHAQLAGQFPASSRSGSAAGFGAIVDHFSGGGERSLLKCVDLFTKVPSALKVAP